MGIGLDGLKPGEWAYLSKREMDMIQKKALRPG